MSDPDAGGGTSPPVRRTIVIVAVLALELLVPLRYYLRGDPWDERFAWRMFSPVRVVDCRSEVDEERAGARRRVDPARTVHASWVAMMRRNREPVIAAFLRRRCRDAERVDRVRLANTCTDATGTPLPALRWVADCARGTVERSSGPMPGAATR